MQVVLDWFERYNYIFFSLFVFFCGYVLLRLIRVANRKFIEESSRAIKLDKTRYRFLNNATTLIVYTLVAIVITNSVPEFRSVALTLFAGAGIFAAVVGLASQQAFSNIVSGIFLVVFRPFRVGDIIKLDGTAVEGTVEDITLRHTVIRNYENCRAVIPNSVIGQQIIINYAYHDEAVCRFMQFMLPLDVDLGRVMPMLSEIAAAHPLFLDRRTPAEIEAGVPKAVVRALQFTDSGVLVRINVWGKDAITAFIVACDLHVSIKNRFDAEGISLGVPNRIIRTA